MKRISVQVTTVLSLDEAQVIERAMRRFGLSSRARFLHEAALHYASHNKTVRAGLRPSALRNIDGEGTTGPATSEPQNPGGPDGEEEREEDVA